MRISRMLIPVAVATFALLAAGCSGDGDDEDDMDMAPPSMEDPGDGEMPDDGEMPGDGEDDSERTQVEKDAAVARANLVKGAILDQAVAGLSATDGEVASIPTSAMAKRANDETTVTLTATTETLNPAYERMNGVEIGMWTGDVHTRGGTEELPATETVTVYTNIEDPTPTDFVTLGMDADNAYNVVWVDAVPADGQDPAVPGHFVLDDIDHLSWIGVGHSFASSPDQSLVHDTDAEKAFMGTFAGAQGMYRCTVDHLHY